MLSRRLTLSESVGPPPVVGMADVTSLWQLNFPISGLLQVLFESASDDAMPPS